MVLLRQHIYIFSSRKSFAVTEKFCYTRNTGQRYIRLSPEAKMKKPHNNYKRQRTKTIEYLRKYDTCSRGQERTCFLRINRLNNVQYTM